MGAASFDFSDVTEKSKSALLRYNTDNPGSVANVTATSTIYFADSIEDSMCASVVGAMSQFVKSTYSGSSSPYTPIVRVVKRSEYYGENT